MTTWKTSRDAVEDSQLLQTIRERITAFRRLRGWKQEVLGPRAGLRPQRLSNIERGVAKLSLVEFLRIAEAFGVTLEEMAYGAPPQRTRLTALATRIEALAATAEELSACTLVFELLLAGLAVRPRTRTGGGEAQRPPSSPQRSGR